MRLTHFIHNVDRNLRNFLFRNQHKGWAVLAFDYSQAWLFSGMPLPELPFESNTKTMLVRRHLVKEFGEYIDNGETDNILQRIAKVTSANIQQIIDGHPKEWLPDEDRDEIIDWWQSKARTDRI